MRSISLSEKPFQIGVFGSGTVDEQCYKLAREVGIAVAKQGHIVINGGHGCVMEASGHGNFLSMAMLSDNILQEIKSVHRETHYSRSVRCSYLRCSYLQ